MKAVLFVCLGNICRSPSAEGIFSAHTTKVGLSGLVIDSAGTGSWHVGNAPDPRAIAAAKIRGIDLSRLRARQVSVEDFSRFDLIVAMDRSNLADLQAMQPENGRARLAMMMDFSTVYDGDVPDPYFGGSDGFETMLDMLQSASTGLVRAFKNP